MNNNIPFSFSLPEISRDMLMTAGAAEKKLMTQFRQSAMAFESSMWSLAQFYKNLNRLEEAMKWIQCLMSFTMEREKQASFYLTLGQIMEKKRDFESAADFYVQALSLEPREKHTKYFSNNNLGYSLNQLREYQEAEPYCRKAISVDPDRHNAHKNLGVSLEGQKRYAEAAESYIKAALKQAMDPRALGHLESLVRAHPEIKEHIMDFDKKLKACRGAVGFASSIQKRFAEDKVGDPPKNMKKAMKIMEAVANLVKNMHIVEFTGEDIRKGIGISDVVWKSDYAQIFEAMHKNQEGGLQKVRKTFQGVFIRVRDEVNALTTYGHDLVNSGNWKIVLFG